MMKRKSQRIAAIFLALAMILALAMPQNVYAKTTPSANYVTRAYVLQQVEKMIGATQTGDAISKVKDVKKNSPYYKTMSIALNAGLVKPNSKQMLYPNMKATNKYVASVLANVSETTTKKMLGKKNPDAKVTKKSLAAFLNQKYPNVVSKSNAKVKKGTVVINKPVVLKNANITGDLIIGDGVGNKEVTLKNVNVAGKTIVRGGGENSVIITGTSNISNMIIRQVNHKVSIKVKGDAKVKMIYINDGSNDVNIVGSVGTVNVVGNNLKVTLSDATVNSFVVAKTAKNAVVEADQNSQIKKVTLNAVGTKLQGDGKVEVVNVNANDTVVTVKDAIINTKENITPPITDIENKDETESDSNKDNSSNEESTEGDSSNSGTTGGGGTSGGGTTGGGTSGGGTTGGGTSGGGTTGGGSSSEGGSSGGTDQPITPEDPNVKYVTDERFADGYPKVETDKEKESITVTYKLKAGVASEETPAKIYNLVTTQNIDWDATTEAVLHGHLGIVNENHHDIVPSEICDYLEITDAEEKSVVYHISGFYNEGLKILSVIDCGDNISETPTMVYLDKETTDSVVINKVHVAGAFVNEARDAIYLYVYGNLNPDTVTNPASFSLKNNDNWIAFESINYIQDLYSGRYTCIKLNLKQEIEKGEEIGAYSLNYSGTEIEDLSGNKLENFQYYVRMVQNEACNAFISHDGQYISVDFPVSMYVSYNNAEVEDLEVYVNDKKIGREKYNLSYSFFDLSIRIQDTSLAGVEKVEVKSASGKYFYTATGDPAVTSCVGFVKDEENCISSASYDVSGNTITLVLSGNSVQYDSFSACNFWVKIGDSESQLRGWTSLSYSQFDGTPMIEFKSDNIKHLDLSDTSDVWIKYDPIIVNFETGRSGYLTHNSGKPVAATGYIPVTIQ